MGKSQKRKIDRGRDPRISLLAPWLRRKLRRMDLEDLRLKRTILSKPEYISRVKRVLKTQKAQNVAKSYARRFRKTCQQVVDRGGAAADN